ncbi:hypothetical protein R2A130_2522 [Ahrensia sp. R2A130]|nr:hypothetical protein R2A130_2522 [Ahrensia sp. R2A130]
MEVVLMSFAALVRTLHQVTAFENRLRRNLSLAARAIECAAA